MASSAVALTVTVLLGASAASQTKPDFSGTWRMDSSRSESAMQGLPVKPITLAIVQTADEIRIETATPEAKRSEVYRFVNLDPAITGKPTARWKGNTLVLDVVRDVRGQSVTVQQSHTLSENHNEMVVESVTNVQHGYTLSGAQVAGIGRDVFIRLRH